MRENDLLQYIYRASGGLASQFPGVSIPPGDDMGAVVIGGQTVLMTVDQVAEGVHFNLAVDLLPGVGRKCITRNLSDVAAMAAKPSGAVAAACLPRNFGEENATALFDALRTTAEQYACPLIGGDISMWDGKLIVTVTVFAEPAGIEPIRRGTARPGDGLYVTGQLGNSLASGHHLSFEPRVALARQLAGDPRTRPSAMIDLSDGLAQDLPRLTEHALIEAALLPIREATPEPRWRHAVGDGEDYELLFALPPDNEAHLPGEIDGVPITRIGRVAADGGVRLTLPDGGTPELRGLGWEHFALSAALLHISTSVAQTVALGRAIGAAANAGDVIALHGELGAGKTQFVRGLAQGMGLDPRQVSSPTFVISHEYLPPPEVKTLPTEVQGGLCLVHVDAYRLTGPDELRTIGLGDAEDDALDDAVLVVEWAERVAAALGDDALHVRLEHDPAGRRITFESRGSWGPRLNKLTLKEGMMDE